MSFRQLVQLLHHMKTKTVQQGRVFGKAQLVFQFNLVISAAFSCAPGYLSLILYGPSAQIFVFYSSEAQVFSQKYSHDLSQVLYSRPVHVLLGVIQCMPELWEGSGDDM